MKNALRALAFLAMLLPGVAAAQCTNQPLPANTVVGRLGIGSGPCQVIPFTTLGAQLFGLNLPNGTTATTQSTSDNTTKVATDAFVQSVLSGVSQPWLTSGSNIYYTTGNVGVGAIPTKTFEALSSSVNGTEIAVTNTNSGTNRWTLQADPSGGSLQIVDRNNAAARLRLSSTGALRLSAYTTAGILSNDTSGNVTSGSGSNIPYTPPGTGAVATTVATVLNRQIWANDFGASCNNSGDDSTALQNALNEATTLGVNLRFIGTCRYATTLSITAGSVEIAGVGAGSTNTGGQSQLVFSTVNGTAISVNQQASVRFHDFGMSYSSSSTSGQFIAVNSPSGNNIGSEFERLVMYSSGANCINFQNSSYWRFVNSQLACVNSVFDISNAISPDAGDSTIYGNLIQASTNGNAIIWRSSGGLRIENNKILGNSMQTGIQILAAAGITTSDILIIGNSIEGLSLTTAGYGIFAQRGAGASVGNVVITGNEIVGRACVYIPTDASAAWMGNVIINANACGVQGSGISTAAINVDGVLGLVITNNSITNQTGGNISATGVGSQGETSTNCVSAYNVHASGGFNASAGGSCTTAAPF